MFRFLPGALRGVIGATIGLINTIFWVALIIPVGIVKFFLPFRSVRRACNAILNVFCTAWADLNKRTIHLLLDIKWQIQLPSSLALDQWYLVIANHQSWVDVLVLQYALNGVIPYFRFFLKKELRWVPLLNIAWWALDYPYMTRYSKEYLQKNPHMKGRDIDATRRSCERFAHTPVSIMNFVEGTRFREERHARQKSPYGNLLIPRAGGVAFVVRAMGDQLASILNVTIVYPQGRRELWDFLCGRVPEITVNVRMIALSDDIVGDYFEDESFRPRFQKWLNDLWREKDALIDTLRESRHSDPP